MRKKRSTEFNSRMVLMFMVSDTAAYGEEAEICNLQYFSQAQCIGCRTAWTPEAKSLSCPQMRLYLPFICTRTLAIHYMYLPITILTCHTRLHYIINISNIITSYIIS